MLDADADGKVAVDIWVDAGGTPTRVKIGLNPTILDLTLTEIGTPVAIAPPPNHRS